MKILRLTVFIACIACSGEERPGGVTSHPAAETSSQRLDHSAAAVRTSYVLGADDQISVHVVEVDEINDKPIRIDAEGFIRLPLVGRIKAGGMTIDQLENELVARLKTMVLRPQVIVSISEFRSQPVSVLGAVKNPGVYQLQGHKTLVEMLSMAGGVEPTAGATAKISRNLRWGRLPVEGASDDAKGQFSVAEVHLKSLLAAKDAEENILLMPDDIVSVPRAEMVYVIGTVPKPGGFTLNDREGTTVLQALSLAGGLDKAAAARRAEILRPIPGSSARRTIPVDLQKMLSGKTSDMPMEAEDILFVPGSASKRAAVRAAEAALQTATGVAIWRF